MTPSELRKNISRFIDRWSRADYKEDGSTAPFWIDLLEKVLGVPHATDIIKFEETFKHEQKGNPLYCDAWIPSLHIIIEQKAPGVALDSSYERHGRTFQSAYGQAYEYDQTLAVSERSRYIITSNFREIWIYDMDVREAEREPVKISLENLAKDYKKLSILIDGNARLSDIVEVEVSVEAGEKVGRLYDLLLAEYKIKTDEITSQMLHALNVLCVRIVFCLYAEDAGLFAPDAFARYLESYRAQNARTALIELFKILDQKKQDRDPFLEGKLAAFPYVNGGLFHDAKISVPPISEELYEFLIHDMSRGFDWSKISPTIFGAVFESTLNPETRRKGGMHYTSIENIHKVIDPLFLDDLREKFETLVRETAEEDKYYDPKAGRKRRIIKVGYERPLLALQEELASLTFLDPACGSGNFLTETFLSLRRLENEIISALFGGDEGESALISEGTNYIRVSITQFHGIEINDFAVTVAKTALWIAESQMLKETENLVNEKLDFLPLKTNANIIEGNALTMDWEEMVPKMKLNYIMGNPPFVGASMMTAEQKKQAVSIFGNIKLSNSIDYVGAWYYKAAALMKGNDIKTALVSTNSITQGEQVAALWKPLYERFGIHIDFAYKTFRWDSEANLKAHVHCVIIGFSCAPNSDMKKIYEITSPAAENKNADESQNENKDKNEIDAKSKNDDKNQNEKPEKQPTLQITKTKSISPYLLPGEPILVESRAKPLCDVPRLTLGNKPADDGNFILSEEERDQLLKNTPELECCIRRYVGARDYLNQKEIRYCLWLKDVNPAVYSKNRDVMRRLEAIREFRSKSTAAPTRKSAEKPQLFFFAPHNDKPYLIIPSTSSERRKYIPIGFMDANIIASNTCHIMQNTTLYHFGILTSNVHMAWMRTVTGRLKSDYSYSGNVVYNTFPWPNPTDEQKEKIERTAKAILDARAAHPGWSLASLYSPLSMPQDLKKAHEQNDRAVFEAYGKPWDITSEPACIAYLMQTYRALTEQ